MWPFDPEVREGFSKEGETTFSDDNPDDGGGGGGGRAREARKPDSISIPAPGPAEKLE